MRLRIGRALKAGDILTSLSILVSILALLNAWSQDRRLREREQADKVRNAASQTLAKLERWQDISLWIFQEMQPLSVETSERLKENFDVIAARDFLWKSINASRVSLHRRVLDEGIETAYVYLYGYHPAVRDLFRSTLSRLQEEEEQMVATLLQATQRDVLLFQDKKAGYETAMLGNVLRQTVAEHQVAYKQRVQVILRPLEQFLRELLLKSDPDVLRRPKVLTTVQVPPRLSVQQ